MTTIEKKKIITDFIARCNDYADAQLNTYQNQLSEAQGMEALAIEAKIYQWKIYQAFNSYTIEELKTDELDPWFDDAG